MIASGTAMLIAGLAGAGATAASNVYGTKKASKINERSIDEQAKSETDTRALAREQAARDEVARQEELKYKRESREAAIAMDQKRYDAYVAANQPYWSKGSQLFGDLLEMAGQGGQSIAMPQGGMPAGATPTAGAPLPSTGADQPSLLDVARSAATGGAAPPQSRGLTMAAQQPFARQQAPAAFNGLSLMDLAKMVQAGRSYDPSSMNPTDAQP